MCAGPTPKAAGRRISVTSLQSRQMLRGVRTLVTPHHCPASTILGQRFYARECAGTLRRATIASTSSEYLVPHSQIGASALPKVLPKAAREYSTFGGISP